MATPVETTIHADGGPTYDYSTVAAWAAGQAASAFPQHGIMSGATLVAGGDVDFTVGAGGFKGTDADPHVLKPATGSERIAGVTDGIEVQEGNVVEILDLLFEPAADVDLFVDVDPTTGSHAKVKRCLGRNPNSKANCIMFGLSIPGSTSAVALTIENCEGHDLGYGIYGQFYGFVGTSTLTLTVQNCTFANNTGDGIYINSLNLGGVPVIDYVFENVICADSGNKDFEEARDGTDTGTSTINNCIDSDNTIVTELGGGTDCIANEAAADLFTDDGNGDFTLKPDSAAVNAGKTIAGITTDVVDVGRPQGPSYDVGAFEWVYGGQQGAGSLMDVW